MINLSWANSQAETLRNCANELQSVLTTIENSLSRISSTDAVTAGPVRSALSLEQGKTMEAQRLLYELADQVDNNAYDIYQAELEEQRRREEEERQQEEQRQREADERRRREEERRRR